MFFSKVAGHSEIVFYYFGQLFWFYFYRYDYRDDESFMTWRNSVR